MRTLAIIAEYNPFHNGHAYHLAAARRLTGADYTIALMGGNFLQRGEPAMWDKYTRAKMCTRAGIDLALELPFAYAAGSAMDFACGAARILDALQVVDYLCFGAETEDISFFEQLSDIVIEEPAPYQDKLRSYLVQGISYPAARCLALAAYMNNPSFSDILSSPNNILALEYMCALKRTGSSIKPILIPRKDAAYHDDKLNRHISSATAIRRALSETPDFPEEKFATTIADDIPDSSLDIIKHTYGVSAPIYPNDLTPFLQTARLISSDSAGNEICDMNRELNDRLRHLPSYLKFTETCGLLKTKNYTATRINRALLHLLLQYTEEDRSNFIHYGYAQYANILSFRRESNTLLRAINKKSRIPLITKKADFASYINQYCSSFASVNPDTAARMWELDTKATELYNCMIYNRYGFENTNDYTTILPIV